MTNQHSTDFKLSAVKLYLKFNSIRKVSEILNCSKSIYNKIKNFTDNTDISNDSKRIIDNIKSLSKKSNDIFKNLNDIFG